MIPTLLDLARQFDAIDHAEMDRRIAAGEELDADCMDALDKRLAIGDQIEKLLGGKLQEFRERFDALTAAEPAHQNPAEAVLSAIGLASHQSPGDRASV